MRCHLGACCSPAHGENTAHAVWQPPAPWPWPPTAFPHITYCKCTSTFVWPVQRLIRVMLAAICQRAAPAAPSAVACILLRPAQLVLDHGFSCHAAPESSRVDAAAEGAPAGGSDAQIAERRASHQQASTSGASGRTYDMGPDRQRAHQWQQRQFIQTMPTSQPVPSLGLLGLAPPPQQQQQQSGDGLLGEHEFHASLLELMDRDTRARRHASRSNGSQVHAQSPVPSALTHQHCRNMPLAQEQLADRQPQLLAGGLAASMREHSVRVAPQQQQQQQQQEVWQRQPHTPEQQQQQQQQQQAPEGPSSLARRLDPLLQYIQQQAGDTQPHASLYTALHRLSEALGVDPWPHLQRLAERCVHHVRVSKRKEVVWAPSDVVAATAAALLQHTTLEAAGVVALLARRPRCLVGSSTAGAAAVLQQLQSELGLAPQQLAYMVRAAPGLLELTPGALAQQLGYLCGEGALGLTTQQAAAVVAANPRVLVVPAATWCASVAFLVGLGLGGDVVRGLVMAAPDLATAPLKDLILRWNYLRAELKGSVEDLSLAPQLLLADLHRNLGPRASFVRKRRFMLLLPSHTAGVAMLTRQESWKQFKMVPLTYVLSAPVHKLCKLLGVHGDEFELYRKAWQATEGKRWSKYTLDAGRPLGTLGEDELALSLMGLCPEADRLVQEGQQQAGRAMLLLQEPRKGRK